MQSKNFAPNSEDQKQHTAYLFLFTLLVINLGMPNFTGKNLVGWETCFCYGIPTGV